MSFALLVAGGAIALLNTYLSWLRYLLHRARGRPREAYRPVSGVPLLGSLLLLGALLGGLDHGARLAALALLALDTGGPHWFVGSLVVQSRRRRAP